MTKKEIIDFIENMLEEENEALNIYGSFLKEIQGNARYEDVYNTIYKIFEDEHKHYMKLQNLLYSIT